MGGAAWGWLEMLHSTVHGSINIFKLEPELLTKYNPLIMNRCHMRERGGVGSI